MVLLDWLLLPVVGGPTLVHWLAEKLAEEVERESLDEGRVRGELLELQQRLDAGEVTEEEYDRQEKALMERLNAIREFKAHHGSQGQASSELTRKKKLRRKKWK